MAIISLYIYAGLFTFDFATNLVGILQEIISDEAAILIFCSFFKISFFVCEFGELSCYSSFYRSISF